MAALRIILPAAAIALTLALFLQLAWPARTPIPRRTSRRGGIAIAVLTAVYAVAAFTGLGSARDPQRFCSFEAGESRRARARARDCRRRRVVLPRPVHGEYALAYSTDGVTFTPAGTMPQGYADLFKWLQPQPADAAPASAAYVRITASAHLELGELALLDAQGERIAVREITARHPRPPSATRRTPCRHRPRTSTARILTRSTTRARPMSICVACTRMRCRTHRSARSCSRSAFGSSA